MHSELVLINGSAPSKLRSPPADAEDASWRAHEFRAMKPRSTCRRSRQGRATARRRLAWLVALPANLAKAPDPLDTDLKPLGAQACAFQ